MGYLIMPLVYDIGISLLSILYNSNSWTDRCTLMEQSLTDRSAGEEQIYPKVGCVHSMDNNLLPNNLIMSDMGLN